MTASSSETIISSSGETPVQPVTPQIAASNFHSAQSVSNIRNHIPLILDLQKVQYHTWAELFQITARAHNVLNHINGSPPPTGLSEAKWQQLDAIVLSWIYGTISDELLLTVIKAGSTAREAWLRVKGIFHDNHTARAADLEGRFINAKLDSFPSVSAYCQHLKSLADQLGDVESAVTDQWLVLQLINGLSPAYDTVGSIISQMNPLPSFSVARSMLTREESRRNRTATEPTHALMAAGSVYPTGPSNNASSYGQQRRSCGRGRRYNPTAGHSCLL